MLEIRSTMGQIGIRTTPPVQSIQQPRGEQSIRQFKPELKIDQEFPQVRIDQSRCFAEAGLKKPLELTAEFAARGREKALEAIGRISEEGDRLADFHLGNPIPDIAIENAYPEYDFNYTAIPQSRPQIDFTGHFHMDWQIKKPEINYIPRKAITQYTPGKANIHMAQWPEINIKYIDKKV